MKMPTAIFPAIALCGAALAADVPQKSQADYYFSVPNATNSVTRTNLLGKVIGQPPAYRSLRREDVAWLREAACERAALANGSWWTTNDLGRTERPVFGHFPLSETNRFSRSTIAREWRNGNLETNIVVGWNWVTNAFRPAWPMQGAALGIDLAKPGQDGVDVFAGLSFGSGADRYLPGTNGLISGSQSVAGDFPPHTNIVTTVVTNWGGFSFEGGQLVWHSTQHVDVVSMPMTNGTVSVHTNLWSEDLPWPSSTIVRTNVTAGSAWDLLFDGREATWDDAPAPAAMKPFPVYSYVTDCYGFLGRKRWLADWTANTNVLRSIVHKWDISTDGFVLRPDTGTNDTASVGLFVDGGYMDGYEAGNGRLVFPTRFDWDVVHTGGVCRIREATLYASVVVSAHWWDSGGAYTNAWGCHVAKVGTAAKVEVPQGGKVCYEATVDGPSLARAGAAAVGAPVHNAWNEWGNASADYSVSFFLVYELQPWASLPGWND